MKYLKKGRNINGEYYGELVQRLEQEIKNKRSHLTKRKIMFHQDIAPTQRTVVATAELHEMKYELISILRIPTLRDFS